MISQRFSNDRVDSNDLKRSIKSILPYSAIAFLALIYFHVYPVAKYIRSEEFRRIRWKKEILSYFLTNENTFVTFIQIGMVLCGALMAITLFRFLLTKKSVNVYLSFGISRSRLFLNRTCAAVFSLFAATFVPTVIAFIINLAAFGASSHLTSVFCYIFLTDFISGLAGFALASVAMTVSGCIAEAVITFTGVSLYSALAKSFISSCSSKLVRGYFYSAGTDIATTTRFNLFNIWAFSTDLQQLDGKSTDIMGIPRAFLDIGNFTKKSDFKALQCVDFGVIVPLLVWLVISAVLIGIGLYLFNKRKSENSNSFGKIYVSSVLNGITVGLIAIDISADNILYSYSSASSSPFFQNLTLCLLLIFGITLICFIIAELIIRRSFKGTAKTLPVYAAAFAVVIFVSVFYSTGYFGKYNKLPDASQIKSVSLDVNSPILFDSAVETKFSSINSQDISMAYSLFDTVKNDKYLKGTNINEWISFKFVLNDGTVITRYFNVFNPEVYNKYRRTVYDSQYYKDFLKYTLLENHSDEQTAGSDEDGYIQHIDNLGNVYYQDTISVVAPMDKHWHYVGSSYLADNYSSKTGADNLAAIADSKGLMEALYKDYISMSYEDAYSNTRTPIGALADDMTEVAKADSTLSSEYGYYQLSSKFMNNDTEKEIFTQGLANNPVYIYPNMTNTIKFLNEQGETPLEHKAKVKELYYSDSEYSAMSIICHYADGSKLILPESFSSDDADIYVYNFGSSDEKEASISYIDFIKKAYAATSIDLKCVTDSGAIDNILSKSIPSYYPDKGTELKGRFIIVVYDDNSMLSLYVPEGNIAVFG